MKRIHSVWKIVLFAALLMLMVGLAVSAHADTCAPGTHKWYYDTHPAPSEGRPCGSTYYVTDHCTVCGETWERTIIISPHKAGTPVERVVPADCLNSGTKTVTTYCIRCNEKMSETTETLAALGHDWGAWVVTTQPTCETKGQETCTCNRDANHKQYRELAALGHNWDSGVITKQPDCTNPGVRTYTCQNDHNHTKTESIPIVPDAHKWDSGKVTKQPNCTEPGVRTYTCTINPSHTKTESIPIVPDAHVWDNGKVTTPATCEAPGERTYTCTLNPSHTKKETIPATGHKWDKGTITKQPSLTETGVKHYVCENDPSHTKDEILPKTTFSNNTICAFGPRLRDVDSYIYPNTTDEWYMFTPFDASQDGRQTFELVASNNYIVGSLTITIRDGKMTVDYTLNSSTIDITLEFFTVLNQIQDIKVYEPEKLLNLNMKVRQPIDLQEKFGDDRNLVLYFCSRADYTYSNNFVKLDYESLAHQRLLNTMLTMMDK